MSRAHFPMAVGPDATVRTRAFFGSQLAGIMVATAVGMAVMFTALIVGLPPLIVVPLFLVTVYLVIGRLSGDSVLTLEETGIRMQWRALVAPQRGAGIRERFVPWERVVSYKLDRDQSRSLQEYRLLEVDLEQPSERLHITDRHDPAGFDAFRDAFLARLADRAPAPAEQLPVAGQPIGAEPSEEVQAGELPADPPEDKAESTREVRRRRSFYETPFALLLTALFVVVSVALGILALAGALRWTHVLRLALVIAPGTLYMVQRVWKARTT